MCGVPGGCEGLSVRGPRSVSLFALAAHGKLPPGRGGRKNSLWDSHLHGLEKKLSQIHPGDLASFAVPYCHYRLSMYSSRWATLVGVAGLLVRFQSIGQVFQGCETRQLAAGDISSLELVFCH